ncbi:MAG TPA: carbohydrate kinase family protein [Patescibacteria group bacterium]|nr:carbohydrate kinase family protein [Patescibacteria group bacterium]
MPQFDFITVGGAVKDFTFYTEAGKIFATPQNLTSQKMLAFEYGAKITVKEAHFNLGGGAANTAASLSHLGFKVAIVTRVGRDVIAQEIINQIKKQNIYPNLIQRDKALASGHSFIIAVDKKEREHVVFLAPEATKNLIFNSNNYSALGANWLYLTSLVGKNWLENIKNIFDFAKRKKINLVWNPGRLQLQGGQKTLSEYLKQTNVLILNKDEAIELVLSGVKLGRRNPKSLNRPIYLLNILQEWGPKIVVITEGKKGAWAYDGKKIYRQKVVSSKTIDTTGVGDAFGSAFISGLINEKNDVGLALRWGMINSASVVTKVGAQNGLLTKNELIKKL